MEKRRIGEDFKYVWSINWNGVAEDFSDTLEMVLTASVYGKRKELERDVDYVVDGNLLKIDCTPKICTISGIYNLELNYVKPSDGFIDGERRSAVDIDAFQIVPKSAQITATGGITGTSDAIIGFYGLSAYEVWLKDNPESTKEDYYNWLRQPATDAVSLIDDKIEHLDEIIDSSTENEAGRVGAETLRLQSENLRISAETERKSNEADRLINESSRASDELIREANESTRKQDEATRKTNENERKASELTRQSSESERNENEGLRAEAESLRFTAESSRKLTESLRVEAEDIRLSNEQSRVDAEALRVSGEVTRNTAEGIRVGNESTRVDNEGIRLLTEEDRIDAEETRVENEALRINAELLREDAESDREDAEQLRQTNTSTAIQNANEATQSANNAAELANTKAGEANTATINANNARDNIMPSVLNNEEVQAETYNDLNERIIALENLVKEAIYSKITTDTIDVISEIKMKGSPLIYVKDEAPSSAPDQLPQFYIDTAARKLYTARGTGSVSDWF